MNIKKRIKDIDKRYDLMYDKSRGKYVLYFNRRKEMYMSSCYGKKMLEEIHNSKLNDIEKLFNNIEKYNEELSAKNQHSMIDEALGKYF